MTGEDYSWLSELQLAETDDESGRVIVSNDAGPFMRASARVADVLKNAILEYPDVDVDRIARNLGGTTESVENVLASVGGFPALNGTTRHSVKRLQLRKPFSIQLTLLDPSMVLRLVPWLPALVRLRAWWWTCLALCAAGLAFLLVYVVTPDSALRQPLSVGQYVGIFLALFLTVFVHEFAHATVLIAHGGTSRRLGVMLFYLAPAFFCDVSDAWRLPPVVRVKIALAGIVAQCTVASIALITAVFVPNEAGTSFVVFGVLCYLFALVNAIPLVKLDGYIALIGYLDRPNLRAAAMEAFRIRVAGILLGTARPTGRTDPPGFLLYGALCVFFPVALVGGVALSVNSYLSSWGSIGAWLTLAVFVIVIVIGAARIVKIIGRAWRSGARRVRSTLIFAASAVVVVMLAAVVPLPVTVSGGIFTVDGQPKFVLVGATVDIDLGAVLTVYPSAAFPSTKLGEVEVTGGSSPCNVPLEALTPMTGTGLRADAQCYTVTQLPARPETTVALLRSPSATLNEQLAFLASRLHG